MPRTRCLYRQAGLRAEQLDCFLYEKSCEIMTAKFVAAMKTKPFQYAFLHYADPDAVGHAHGWGSDAYQEAIRKVDAQLGRLFQLIETSHQLRGKTTIFLSADHGGKDHNHANNLLPEVYTIPVYVWGCGAAVGQDLYKLNAATRRDPGTGHPLHTDPVQPIRNGDGANLALKLFGSAPFPVRRSTPTGLAIGPRVPVCNHAPHPQGRTPPCQGRRQCRRSTDGNPSQTVQRNRPDARRIHRTRTQFDRPFLRDASCG